MVVQRTTVELDVTTREKLKELGKKSETYDKLVNRLIDFYVEHNKRGGNK